MSHPRGADTAWSADLARILLVPFGVACMIGRTLLDIVRPPGFDKPHPKAGRWRR